ncbi:MAG: porin family protein [Prevotella sp.]|jgi:opacity protein-like surface antigen|nr:porin family protein [Prevotella sp.]
MKKLFLIAAIAVFSFGAYAQTGTMEIMPKLGYQTEFKRALLGVEGRYYLDNNIRLAPDVSVLFPNNRITGLDVNLNVHYTIPLGNDFTFYPLVGGAMLNNRWSPKEGDANSWTDFGLSVGAGIQYQLYGYGYLNFEFRYTIIEGKDPAYFMLGYAIRL